MKRKAFSLVLLFTLVFSAGVPFNAARSVLAQGGHAKWTIMVYMAANNNLEPNSIINLMEMAAIGSTKDVNIVVQITRPADYSGFYGTWGGTRRFLVTKSNNGLSAGDFQISQSRLDKYLAANVSDSGLTQADVDQITRAPIADQEKVALKISVPTIEPKTPLTALQLKSVQDLGATVNSGSGDSVSDFGTWAVQNYPADHYGLIMWDHGGGWSMIASDDAAAPDGITMPGFQKALATITQASGQPFDFIGFDACLMSQLPVAVTIRKYAKYEIASEELVPGFGWDYEAPLRALVANPALTATDFARAEIDAFSTLYSTTEKAATGSFDIGLVDLTKVDAVVNALSAFNTAAKTASGNLLKVIGTARSNAQSFGTIGETPADTDAISSVDLSDFMRLTSSLSTDNGVKQAAKGVIQSVTQMELYHKTSNTLPNANGLSVFFPKDSDTFNAAGGDRYRSEFSGVLPDWLDFLDTFYSTAKTSSQTSNLKLKITNVSTTEKPGSVYDTPIVTYDLNGTNIVGVNAYILYQVNKQTSVILDSFPVVSSIVTEDGTQVNNYADGETIVDFYWNTKIPSLTDGTNQLLVLMTTNKQDEKHGFIRGQYTNHTTGKQTDASLLINLDTYQSSGLWATQNTASHATAELFPKPGDTFEPVYVVLDAKGNSQATLSGTKLTFGSTPFSVTDKPGPDGKYTIVLDATDSAGTDIQDTATVNIKNSGLDPALQGFKDLGTGVSFLYPTTWADVQTLQHKDGSSYEYVTDETGDIELDVLNYTDVQSLADVQQKGQDALTAIAGATIGTTKDIQVGKYPGSETPYQYTDNSGATIYGMLVAVYVPDTQAGYILQIEAPDGKTDAATSALNEVLRSIQFFTPPVATPAATVAP